MEISIFHRYKQIQNKCSKNNQKDTYKNLNLTWLSNQTCIGDDEMMMFERIIIDKSNPKRLLEIKMESNDGEFIDDLEKVIQDYIDGYDNGIYISSKRPYRLVG